jgi:membrane peptidoglycan carboxypeptidase
LQATENSINSAYVELEADIGVDSVADAAVRAGIPADTPGMDLDQLDLTFVLGTASPSGLDMANAYATFAGRGAAAQTSVVTRVVGPNGGLLFELEPQVQSVFDSVVSDTVTYALTRVVTNGTGTTAQALGRPAAAKTGTTDENKSAWFVGYTPQLSTAVLMAKEDDDGIPVSLSGTGGLETVTGGSFPAAIWTAFMTGALEGQPVQEFPPPPAGTETELDCPSFITSDLEEVPFGCPTPEVIPEFSNEPSPVATLPGDPAVGSPSPTPSQSPDDSLFSPSAEPTEQPPEPIEEGRPE